MGEENKEVLQTMEGALMGKFIVFEGGDGAGKTTIMNTIAENFRRQSLTVYLTEEPSNRRIGRWIKRYQRDTGEDLPKMSEAWLYMADRYDHTFNEIIPALERNDLVLCDRYSMSTIAYQGEGHQDKMRLQYMHEWWALKPALTLFLDVPPAVGLSRIKGGERFENLERAKLVHQNYMRQVRLGDMLRIDATLPIEGVVTLCQRAIVKRLWRDPALGRSEP